MDIYHVVGYPKGKREVIATLHGLSRMREDNVRVAAMRAGVDYGTEAEGIINHVISVHHLRADVSGFHYVDVLRNGDHIATVGLEGVI